MFELKLPRWRRSSFVLMAVSALAGCGETSKGPPTANGELARDLHRSMTGQAGGDRGVYLPPSGLDVRRSLAVTDQVILQRFSLERVLNKIVSDSAYTSTTATDLFQQWWDTQNPNPGTRGGRHCDKQVHSTLGTVLGGYPYLCRPAPSEGAQATCDPFAEGSPCAYIPIGLFNRFDRAPADGSNCGEYRILFAKATGLLDRRDRVTLIFEAVMPNPKPNRGLAGCRKVVNKWARLTNRDNINRRANQLEKFFFEGFGNIPPAVSLAHYGDNPDKLGHIRTNQFSATATGWSLRQYRLRTNCNANRCRLRMVPERNGTNAFGELFNPESAHPQAAGFRNFFPKQVAALAADSVADIGMFVRNRFNSGQSQASGETAAEMKYLEQFGADPSPLRTAIQAKLDEIGSTLTPDNIVQRAQTTSCAGCHRISRDADLGGGLTWPADLGFVHVSERVVETVDGEERFGISPALENFFLPHRKNVMEGFLDGTLGAPATAAPSASEPEVVRPIGGSLSHG